MPIPSLNEFFVPFLEVLSDGQPHSRTEIQDALVQRFDLTESELRETNGKQKVISSRLIWCDVYLCKAGFVEKENHKDSSSLDCFRIASRGQLQLKRYANRINVAYLQSFYRGHIYRGATSRDTVSDAELDLYALFDKLPKDWTIFHSLSWFAQGKGSVGEIDFLIAHPDWGLLVLEIKGGVISTERDGYQSKWYSRARSGLLNEIKDPFDQAERSRRQLIDYLQVNQFTKRFRYAIFGAVAFPDSVLEDDLRMDAPADIVIDMRHLDSLQKRLLEIFAYWSRRADEINKQMDGQSAIDALVEALVPSRKLSPRLADSFERERRRIDQLTEQQFRILASLRSCRRAAIIGGAGTGKTVLALEKSHQLAADGMRVLFLAYNRRITDWASKILKAETNITALTFHSLVGKMQHVAGIHHNRDMSQEEFVNKAPDLLLDAAQVIRKLKPEFLFDAIVVDESQDLSETSWISLPELLSDPVNGILYVFFDENQRLYTQVSNIPIQGAIFHLVENCRNTQRIHASMMPYTREESFCDGPQGRDIEIIDVDNQGGIKQLRQLLHRLINEQGVSPKDIVILTGKAEKNSQWKDGMQLGNFVLSWDAESQNPVGLSVSTVYSFKGLEAAVIILTELDRIPSDVLKQVIYVGLSRAKHHVIVLGRLPKLD